MKKILIGILCAATFAISAPVNDIGALEVVGNQIQGANGQPAQLMGMSFYHAQHKAGRDFVKRSVVTSIAKDWRASVVRMPMMYESETGTGGGKGYGQDQLNSIKMVDSIVKAAIDLGIYVIIDWHEVNVIGHQNEAVTFFTDMAQKWGSYPNVIYEVFNEPTSTAWSGIKTYATAVINAIRTKDSDNLIIVGTRSWCQEVMEAAKDPLKDSDGKLMSNVAYVLHFYSSTPGHQGLRARADSAMTAGIALFVSEWGNSTNSGGGELNTAYMDTFMNWMLDKKLSWCNWSLSDIPESSAALRNGTWNAQGMIAHSIASTDGGWADSDLSQSGLFVRNKILANRPAWTDPSTVGVYCNTPQHKESMSFTVVNTSAGIELKLDKSHNWTSASMFNLNGSLITDTRLTPGTSSAVLNPGTNANGLTVVQVKDAAGASRSAKINIMR